MEKAESVGASAKMEGNEEHRELVGTMGRFKGCTVERLK